MKFPVDLSQFEGAAHSPSFLSLQKSLGDFNQKLRDYCVPVNPYFPTPALMERIRDRFELMLKYYPGQNESIALNLCRALGYRPENVVVANGSTELISWINVLFIKESIATPIPTFGRWTDLPLETGKQVHLFRRKPEDNFALDLDGFVSFVRKSDSKIAVICNPNNPTGAMLSKEAVIYLLEAFKDLDLVVVDESFLDFSTEGPIPTISEEAQRRTNVILLKSLGKNFGLHGLRMGYAVAHREITKKLRTHIPHWNLNGLAELLIEEFPNYLEAYEESRQKVIRDRIQMIKLLKQVDGLKVYPSMGNYAYLRLTKNIDGVDLRNYLLTEHGYLVRECGNKLGGSSQYFRIAARPQGEIERLVHGLEDGIRTLEEKEISCPLPNSKPNVPLQAAL